VTGVRIACMKYMISIKTENFGGPKKSPAGGPGNPAEATDRRSVREVAYALPSLVSKSQATLGRREPSV
jgi:hypothetical protein